jgi:hypothetical protein
MNVLTSQGTPHIIAKLLSKQSNQKVLYAFSDNSEVLFVDKKDVVLGQIQACEKLLKYAMDKSDREILGKEINELKSALDLLY